MFRKSLVALSIVASLLVSSVSVCAEEPTQNEYITGSSSGSMGIEVTVEETYQIVIPAKLTLQFNQTNGNYEGIYTIGVKANLLNGEKVIVKPRCTHGNAGNYNKISLSGGAQLATVSQLVNTWTPVPTEENEIASSNSQYVEVNGTVMIPRAEVNRAGTYSGSLEFAFTKTNV